MKYAIILALIGMQAQAALKSKSSLRGAPSVVSVAVETRSAVVDMQGKEYAIIRVAKAPNSTVTAEITNEYLTQCEVLSAKTVDYYKDVDVVVSFDYENDGGYNSCNVKITNGSQVTNVELGTEAGE